MSQNKKVAYTAMLSALYVVLGMSMKIPLISHIQTDLGYFVFGVAVVILGPLGAVVGVVGCLLESQLINGWVPIGWMAGQLFIGVCCGLVFRGRGLKKIDVFDVLFVALVVFCGVGAIKTMIECLLYHIPLLVKLPKNAIASVADTIPMVLGLFFAKDILIKRGIVK